MSLSRRSIRRIVLSARPCSSVKSLSQYNIYSQLEQCPINIQQPQLIREEKQDNAIFRIYLKRSQKKTSTPPQSYLTIQKFAENPLLQNQSGTNSNPGELVYSAVEVYQLKAGTLEKIVECLTNKDGDLETVHMHILYATYRTYTNTRTLIDTILARYRAVIPASLDMTEDVRIKTLKNLSLALICLLTAYKEDFYEPPNYTTLIHLLTNAIDDDLESQCQTLLDRFSTEGENAFQSDSNTSMHRVDKNNNSKNLYFDEDLYHQKGFSSDARRNFLDMSHVKVAEQLTIFDAELLTRVLPYECLTNGSNSTNRRGLNPNRLLTTVDKTIEQFNAVVHRVIATILKEKNEQIRARVIEKWIDIAHECRQLRNFSTLTAILNGLQAECIWRLVVAWKNVDANHYSILKGLKNDFDSCGPDRTQVRKIHDRQLDEIRLILPDCTEGTAKYADITTAINATLGRKPRPNRRGDQENTMIGTVPYLGLYLSDLTYIDSANENYVNIDENDKSSQKLINFEKHRKIFEILAQIKLFQSVANAYRTLKAMPNFKQWFDSVQIHTEAENWQRSYQIQPREPVDNVDSPQPTKTHENPLIANRSRPLKAFPSQISLESLATANNQIIDVTAPSGGSSPSSSSLDKMSIASIRSFPQRQQSNTSTGFKSIHSNHSRSSSASSCLTNASSSQGYMSAQGSPTNSVINCTVNSIESNTLIAKVQLVGRNDLLYKKVRIGDNERTSSVLKSILEKFGLDPLIYECYCIEQQLPDRKIVLMDHCNVFYALARKSQDEQVDLTVREKTRQEREQTKNRFCPPTDYNRTPSGISVSSTHSR